MMMQGYGDEYSSAGSSVIVISESGELPEKEKQQRYFNMKLSSSTSAEVKNCEKLKRLVNASRCVMQVHAKCNFLCMSRNVIDFWKFSSLWTVLAMEVNHKQAKENDTVLIMAGPLKR